MRNVTVERKVAVALTADQWQLYKGGEVIVEDLNSEVAEAINKSKTREEAYSKASKVLWEYRDWGTADTEGHYALSDILNAVYGEE